MTTLDSLELAVLNSRVRGIANAMMNTLLRSGRSGVINTGRDFSCCIVTADDQLLESADSLPIHIMSGPDIMASWIRRWHDDVAPGDAFLHNSPYHGCSHAADLSVLVPVFDDEGHQRFTVVAKAHQADIGNAQPTTYVSDAADVYAEGALIFPGVRVQRNYTDIDDIIRMCRSRIRVPDQWWGDHLAALGAARIGEQRIIDLAAEVGWDTLDTYVRDWLDYSETRMRRLLEQIPAGVVTAETAHDPAPDAPEGIPVRVTIESEPELPRITIDLRDNVDALRNGLNLSEACARSAALIATFNALGANVPANAGSCRPIEVKIRDGSTIGGTRHPYSCSVATTNVSDRVTNCVQRGFASLGQGIGMGEISPCNTPGVGVVSGDTLDGESYVTQIFLGFAGGAATPTSDAWLTTLHAGNSGYIYRDSVEIDESRLPLRVVQQAIVPDTEGDGEYRGAPAALVEFGPTEAPLDVIYTSDGTHYPALGAAGGGHGARARQHIRRADGTVEDAPAAGRVTLHPGDTIIGQWAGGGGYGDPRRRAPERVGNDVASGFVSPERARLVYGFDAPPSEDP